MSLMMATLLVSPYCICVRPVGPGCSGTEHCRPTWWLPLPTTKKVLRGVISEITKEEFRDVISGTKTEEFRGVISETKPKIAVVSPKERRKPAANRAQNDKRLGAGRFGHVLRGVISETKKEELRDIMFETGSRSRAEAEAEA